MKLKIVVLRRLYEYPTGWTRWGKHSWSFVFWHWEICIRI